jgi:Domain of unknown function (DUF3859)
MKNISLAILVLPIILGCSTTPVAPITAEISIYGITSSKNELRVPLAESPTKMMRTSNETTVIAKTNEIPMKIGTAFGICAEFSGVSASNRSSIKRFISHPQMKTVDGKTRTEFSYPAVLKTIESVTSDCHGYGLDYEFELLPGIWIIGYQQNDKLIVSKEFHVK